MNSGGSSSGKTPSMPTPQGQIAPYGQTSNFSPQFVSFLPDGVGADGRAPMATGLDQGHLAAIRNAPPPPLLSAQGGAGGPGGDLKTQLAQLLAEQKRADMINGFKAAALNASAPGHFGGRGLRGRGSDRGGYTSSSRSAADRASSGGRGAY